MGLARYRFAVPVALLTTVLAACSSSSSDGGTCHERCNRDATEASSKVCGTDKTTYDDCSWTCNEVPAGVGVFPGACQADGSPAEGSPPYAADGEDVCDWFDVGGEWKAVECADDLDTSSATDDWDYVDTTAGADSVEPTA